MAHWRPPFFRAKNDTPHPKIYTFPRSYRHRARLWGRGWTCIYCPMDNNFRNIASCRPPWRALAWRPVFWWNGRRDSWIRTCSCPCRNVCRGSSSGRRGAYRTCRSTYSLRSTAPGKSFLSSTTRFSDARISGTTCCTLVDNMLYTRHKI